MTEPTPLKSAKILDPGQQACIELLAQLLDNARRGEITTIGVVACGPNDFGFASAGPQADKLYLGLAVGQQDILSKVTAPKPSGIIQPGRRR